ncbi:protein doublesex-like isoform X1 [Ceratina calcarata]|uniref:Protein doublesex-like isoform X1 n=1 Tax=Ceratina calcarata TaxID=156304 RepID=A0AAJ7IY99_9HYME|nr:protein doublesex-like isoform X1 [Ceratina calcarata]
MSDTSDVSKDGIENWSVVGSMRSDTNQPKNKVKNCARCRNHGLYIPLKSHKRFCKYRNCVCDQCFVTFARQRVTAVQIALRRAVEQDEVKIKLKGEVDPLPVGLEFPFTKNLSVFPDGTNITSPASQAQNNVRVTRRGRRGRRAIERTRKTADGYSVELLLDYSTRLLTLYQLPWNCLPLMYISLKYAGANLEEVMKRIDEAVEPKIFSWDTSLNKIILFYMKLLPI